MAISIPVPQRVARTSPRFGIGAGAALFGPACAIALLVGVCVSLWLPGLPPRLSLAALLAVGSVLAWRGEKARLAGVALCGFAFAGLHAAHALQQQIPRALEGKALELDGRIVELPLHEARRTRFEFVVDGTASQPADLRGKRLRVAWFDEDPAARARAT